MVGQLSVGWQLYAGVAKLGQRRRSRDKRVRSLEWIPFNIPRSLFLRDSWVQIPPPAYNLKFYVILVIRYSNVNCSVKMYIEMIYSKTAHLFVIFIMKMNFAEICITFVAMPAWQSITYRTFSCGIIIIKIPSWLFWNFVFLLRTHVLQTKLER